MNVFDLLWTTASFGFIGLIVALSVVGNQAQPRVAGGRAAAHRSGAGIRTAPGPGGERSRLRTRDVDSRGHGGLHAVPAGGPRPRRRGRASGDASAARACPSTSPQSLTSRRVASEQARPPRDGQRVPDERHDVENRMSDDERHRASPAPVAPAEHDAHRGVADERPEALVQVVAAAQHGAPRG